MASDTTEGSLVVGKTYFLLGYFDEALRLPDIRTQVYAGKNLAAEDTAHGRASHYFQGAESFVRNGLRSKSSSLAGMTVVPADSLMMVYGWDALIRELAANWSKQTRGEVFD